MPLMSLAPQTEFRFNCMKPSALGVHQQDGAPRAYSGSTELAVGMYSADFVLGPLHAHH